MKLDEPNKKWLYLVFILAFVFWINVANPHLIAYDQAVFYTAGEEILEGNGYVIASHPDTPPDTYRPFLFPAWLSILMLLSKSVYFLKFTQLLLFIGSGYLFYLLVLEHYSERAAFLASLFFLLNPFFVIYSSLIMSEMPYIFLSLLALYFFTSDDKKYLFLSGIIVGLTFMVKSTGITLFAALLSARIIGKKSVIPFLFGFLIISAWYFPQFANSMIFAPGGTGFSVEQAEIEQMGEVSLSTGAVFSRLLSGASYYLGLPMRFAGIAGLIVFPFLLYAGYIYASNYYRKEYRHIVVYSILFMGIILWWPWRDIRFILPVLVFIFPVVSLFYEHIEARLKIRKYFPLIVVLFVASSGFATLVLGNSFMPDEGWTEYMDSLEYLSAQPTGNIIARRCGEAYYYSGKHCTTYPFSGDRTLLLNEIAKYQSRYFIYDSLSWTDATTHYYGWIKEEGKYMDICFEKAYASGETEVYNIVSC